MHVVTHVPWCMSGSLTCGGGENIPGIPGACAPAILRIWQEAPWYNPRGAEVSGILIDIVWTTKRVFESVKAKKPPIYNFIINSVPAGGLAPLCAMSGYLHAQIHEITNENLNRIGISCTPTPTILTHHLGPLPHHSQLRRVHYQKWSPLKKGQ